jgi:hypothetical protein
MEVDLITPRLSNTSSFRSILERHGGRRVWKKNIKTGAVREYTLSAIVGDWEDVSVSAGTFRAIKITTQTELLDRATGQRSTGTDISWYAPNIRRSVKSEVTSQNFQGNQERQLIQMIQYDLK